MSYYKVVVEKESSKRTFYVAAESASEVSDHLPQDQRFSIEKIPITRVHDLRSEYERSEHEQPAEI